MATIKLESATAVLQAATQILAGINANFEAKAQAFYEEQVSQYEEAKAVWDEASEGERVNLRSSLKQSFPKIIMDVQEGPQEPGEPYPQKANTLNISHHGRVFVDVFQFGHHGVAPYDVPDDILTALGIDVIQKAA